MDWDAFDRDLVAYLRFVQQATAVGRQALAQEYAQGRLERRVYRWHRRYGDQLQIIPSITVEYLGLVHAHIVIHSPDESWLACPYAVEGAWLNRDLIEHSLYLHCLVPVLHQRIVQEYFTRPEHGDVAVVWSGTGWQRFLGPEHEAVLSLDHFRLDFPDDLLAREPIIVPVVMESYQHPNSMREIWQRIKARRGVSLRAYLRERHWDAFDGKRHVRRAFDRLRTEQLIRQNIVRYHPLLAPNTELFLHARLPHHECLSFLRTLTGALYATEVYPTSDGYLCRLLGPDALLERISTLPAALASNCASLASQASSAPRRASLLRTTRSSAAARGTLPTCRRNTNP